MSSKPSKASSLANSGAGSSLKGSSVNILVPRERDFRNAKSFLLKPSQQNGMCLYDFLVKVIRRLYENREKSDQVNMEQVCRDIKRELYRHKPSTLRPVKEISEELKVSHIEHNLYQQNFNANLTDEDAGELTKLPNLIQTFFYFEQAGIGLNREEIIRLWLSMKKLLDQQPIETMRFWGKIFGRDKNYYIVETDLVELKSNYEDEIDIELKERTKEEAQAKETAAKPDAEEEDTKEIIDEPPKPEWKPTVKVPHEENGMGVNKKVYFVCNVLGEAWIRLPKVTPEQIATSRLIKKYFTGNLDASLESFPPFPGKERNYLRALIARITASTLISPQGFYTFDEEEEEAAEEEEGAVRSKFVEDPEWEPIPLNDLADKSFANWVHHAQYILPQGRTSWWNPTAKKAEELEEEEEDEEKEEMDEPEPETGPPLLTPINEDEELNGLPPWTTKLSSKLVPQYGVAVISSNRWPGAHAFASGRTFDNIYIGWGDKYILPNHSPMSMPSILNEFPSGAEITEIEDPTPDEEAAFRAAQAQAAEAAEEGEEGEEGEEEEEEEEDD